MKNVFATFVGRSSRRRICRNTASTALSSLCARMFFPRPDKPVCLRHHGVKEATGCFCVTTIGGLSHLYYPTNDNPCVKVVTECSLSDFPASRRETRIGTTT